MFCNVIDIRQLHLVHVLIIKSFGREWICLQESKSETKRFFSNTRYTLNI